VSDASSFSDGLDSREDFFVQDERLIEPFIQLFVSLDVQPFHRADRLRIERFRMTAGIGVQRFRMPAIFGAEGFRVQPRFGNEPIHVGARIGIERFCVRAQVGIDRFEPALQPLDSDADDGKPASHVAAKLSEFTFHRRHIRFQRVYPLRQHVGHELSVSESCAVLRTCENTP